MASHNRREQLREEGEARNNRWQKLTPEQQLKELDFRLGVGQGASKQRKKIQKKINEAKQS